MVKKEVEHAIQRVYIYIHIYTLFEKKKKRILETLWPILLKVLYEN